MSIQSLLAGLLVVAVVSGGWRSVAVAQPAEKEWTAILLMSATYLDMDDKLAWTGASDDVNVVVLHDNDGNGLDAYRMLPDTNPVHPIGECCPGTETDCCGSEPLPLSAMGVSAFDYIYEPWVLPGFFDYVVDHFPARHYLISLRGQMNGPMLLQHNGGGGGMTIGELASALATITNRTGTKIDVVNFGFCFGAVVDWAYDLRGEAQYLTASANYTNPPVASRWRLYMWVRELMRDPLLTARELALLIPEDFAVTSDYCIAAGHECLNTNPPNLDIVSGQDEPWTASAIDLGAVEGLAAATRDLVCALVADYAGTGPDFEAALANSCHYGAGYWAEYKRPDLLSLAQELAANAADPAVRQAALALGSAVDGAVIANRFQQSPPPPSGGTWFGGGEAFGLTAFVPSEPALDRYEQGFGSFQLASNWRLLVETRLGVASWSVDGLTIEPSSIDATVGDEITVAARATSSAYGVLCPIPVDWDTADLLNVGELQSDANPSVFRALLAGRGTLRAQLGATIASIPITVRSGGPGTTSLSSGEPDPGCSCVSGPGAGWIPVALAVARLLSRRRRRR
jgi:MYXO-CTERM domain-containing protein